MLKQDAARPLPFFYVGKKLTRERIGRYAKNKHILLSEKLGKPDTKSVWYTKEHITQLLEEMNHAGADGLRIHLGEYGENDTYSGQSCLLMVMTKPGTQNGGHIDITIEEAADFNARSFDNTTPRDFNVGSPCPPICDGGDDGDDDPEADM
jgi:hypothetical protein